MLRYALLSSTRDAQGKTKIRREDIRRPFSLARGLLSCQVGSGIGVLSLPCRQSVSFLRGRLSLVLQAFSKADKGGKAKNED
jgi:hypothetical protein